MPAVPDTAKYGTFNMERGGTLFDSRNLAAKIHNPDFLSLFLSRLSFFDKRFLLDDFEGDTINLDNWIVTGDTGTTSFAVQATNTSAESIITADTAGDDNEFVAIYGHCNWKGDKNCGMAVRWKLDDVTDIALEFGFSDPLSDYTLPAIDDIDTPTITNGAVTVAVVAMDTDQTLKTAALILDGDSTYATSKSNLGTWAPTASQWYTTVIQCVGDTVFTATYNTTDPAAPVLQAGTNVSASGFEGGTLVEPRFSVGNRTTDGGLPAIDFIAVWQNR